MPYGRAALSVLVDGVEQQVYYSLDGNHHYVVARPGPYQLKVVVPTMAAVELLAYDGDMPCLDFEELFAKGDLGELYSSAGTFIVEHLVGLGTRTPLVFGESPGRIGVRLFNQRQFVADGRHSALELRRLMAVDYVRSPEIGKIVINYGPELPS